MELIIFILIPIPIIILYILTIEMVKKVYEIIEENLRDLKTFFKKER